MMFFLGFVISGLLPPNKPSWTPQETVDWMRAHHERINVGAAMLMISGMFYLLLSAGISAQPALLDQYSRDCRRFGRRVDFYATGLYRLFLPIILQFANEMLQTGNSSLRCQLRPRSTSRYHASTHAIILARRFQAWTHLPYPKHHLLFRRSYRHSS